MNAPIMKCPHCGKCEGYTARGSYEAPVSMYIDSDGDADFDKIDMSKAESTELDIIYCKGCGKEVY